MAGPGMTPTGRGGRVRRQGVQVQVGTSGYISQECTSTGVPRP